jgi:hypothetical protein
MAAVLLEFISPTLPRTAPCKDAAVSFSSSIPGANTAVKYIQNKTTSSN